MQSTLQYIADYLRFPQSRPYLREGYAIAWRAERCAWFWRHHLERSRNFVAQHMLRQNPESILVLGAGRLFDLPNSFPTSVRHIHLVDIDRSCESTWRRARRVLARRSIELSWEYCDITGRFEGWGETLRSTLRENQTCSTTALAQTLRMLATTERTPNALPRPDLVVSLNILSQLALGAGRLLNAAIAELWRPKNKLDASTLLSHAGKELACLLEFEHLGLLSSLKAALVLTVADTTFYRYDNRTVEWSAEDALSLPRPFGLPDYHATSSERWLWHLAPQGIEHADHGLVHAVEGVCFERS